MKDLSELIHSTDRLSDALFRRCERDADVSLPTPAEERPWSKGYAALFEQERREPFRIPAIRNAHPDVQGRLRRCNGEKIGRGCGWLLTAVVDDTMMILAKL